MPQPRGAHLLFSDKPTFSMFALRLRLSDFLEEMAEIAKLDGTKKYYHAVEEQVEKYATMHLPFEG